MHSNSESYSDLKDLKEDIFQDKSTAVIPLPPRNDDEAEVTGEFDFPPGKLNFEGQDFIFPDGCNAKVIAKWLEEKLLSVRIYINTKIIAECARCLKPVDLNISDKLEYLYYAEGTEILEDDSDDEIFPVEIDFFGRTLDVMQQIQESIFTLLPFKVLCKEDCKGLCPNCGADLNETTCSCKNDFHDPRMEALKDLKLD